MPMSTPAPSAVAGASGSSCKGKGKEKGGGKDKGKGKGKGKSQEGSSGQPAAANASGPCKFFGSAKGCSNEQCPFQHDSPNSVPPCSFKQKLGHCERGEACTFRHVPWASAEQARLHYASREKGALELSTQRYKQLHRDGGAGGAATSSSGGSGKAGSAAGDGVALVDRIKPEHVEGIVEREMQVETYGSKAMKMMEKMGYTAGSGLGREEQGRTKLLGPALELEKASQSSALGLGLYTGTARSTVAERKARLAEARAAQQQRVQGGTFVQHNLLSSDESSDGEEVHCKARDKKLRTA